MLFNDFCDLINYTLLIYSSDFNNFRHVGLFCFVFMHNRLCGDIWSVRSRDLIAIVNHHLSEGVHNTF